MSRLVAAALFFVALLLLAPWLSKTASAQSGISSPAAGSAISGDVPVIGTAVIEPFQKYELHFKIEPSGDDGYVYFDGNTSPVNGGQLGIWRASGLAPGIYTLRLRVVKADGNYAEFFAPNLSVNQGPAPTPTSASATITPTSSIPTPTYTPAPSATPNVGAVVQPQLSGPTPTPATPAAIALAPVDPNAVATPVPAVAVVAGDLAPDQASSAGAAVEPETITSSTRELGEALSVDRLRTQFVRGMRFSAALLLVAVALYSGKRVFDWARRRYG